MHVALPKSRAGDKAAPADQRLGFLAAGRDPKLGYVGGYLITTPRGRPLEFHYTTPVKPSPTHRILYGAELEPYIFEELIAAGLIRQSSAEPAFIIADQPLVLRHRPKSACPIVCVADGNATCAGAVQTHADFADDSAALRQWIEQVNPGLQLAEPFARVWEALHEVLAGEAKQQAA